jgi:hypothetical protein
VTGEEAPPNRHQDVTLGMCCRNLSIVEVGARRNYIG